MDDKNLSDEFAYIMNHLDKIARLVAEGDKTCLFEAAFILGCLHNICKDNVNYFHEIECKAALHG